MKSLPSILFTATTLLLAGCGPPHIISGVRTYSDTNTNGLYDTAKIQIYDSSRLVESRTTKMRREMTKEEILRTYLAWEKVEFEEL